MNTERQTFPGDAEMNPRETFRSGIGATRDQKRGASNTAREGTFRSGNGAPMDKLSPFQSCNVGERLASGGDARLWSLTVQPIDRETTKTNIKIMKETISRFCSQARYGLMGAALLAVLTTVAFTRFVKAENAPKATPVALSVSETPVPREATGKVAMSFAPVVKQVAQSVVQVDVSTKGKDVQMPGQPMPFNDDLLRRLFGNQFQGLPGQPGGTYHTPKQAGLGSGVIVSKDGYIISNNHVVDGADTIKVTLNDGRRFTAKVVGRDPKTDIAVIKIDAKDLPFLTLADSDKIEVGDVCLAIGNPFGLSQTVTMGIVSATGRNNIALGEDSEPNGGYYQDFIQTDAAINPGNSGGALVDTEGRLIGINTAILSRDGGNQGIGFAVPVNMAKTVMESLITKGKVIRGYLGVSIQDITPGLAEQFNLKDDQHGALVGDVVKGSPAEKAGFKSGDIVVDYNGKAVTDSSHLRLQVADTEPGASVPVKVIRNGSQETLHVTVKELPGSEAVAKNDTKASDSSESLNGVTVSDIDPRVAKQLGLPQGIKGALVTDVDQDSAAYEAGLKSGSVIEEINHQPVTDANAAVKLTENLKDKKILLKVWSANGSHYLVVDESNAG